MKYREDVWATGDERCPPARAEPAPSSPPPKRRMGVAAGTTGPAPSGTIGAGGRLPGLAGGAHSHPGSPRGPALTQPPTTLP